MQISVPYFKIVLLALVLSTVITGYWTSKKTLGFAFWAIFFYDIGAMLFLSLSKNFTPGEADSFFKIFVLGPTCVLLGAHVFSADKGIAFIRAFVSFGLFLAPCALVEWATKSDWLPQTSHEFAYNDASNRVRLFSEHPLVLGVLLTLLAFMYLFDESRKRKLVLYLLVFLAALTTQSSAATALIGLAPILLFVKQRYAVSLKVIAHRFSLILALAVGLVLGFGFFTNPEAALITQQGDQASTLYRFVIYAAAWKMLALAPTGFGLLGLPLGLFYVPSAYGDLDLGVSLDSELAVSVAQFGWLGLGSFILLVVLALRNNESNLIDLAYVALLSCGMFIALHSWPSLCLLLFLFTGSRYASISGFSFKKKKLLERAVE